MQKPSGTEGIARASENIYDHGHKKRVKAWGLTQEDKREEARTLWDIADMCDRT